MSKLENLIASVQQLPSLQQRGVSAIVGAAVADAASRPLHWIYNQETLNNILGDEINVEFWAESKSPFYTIPLGEKSTCSDAAYVTLSSLCENNGSLRKDDICEKLVKHFGAGTKYEDAYKRRRVAYEAEDRKESPGPIEGPWISAAMLHFLDKYVSKLGEPYGSSKSDGFNGFCLALPIVAQRADAEDLWNIVSPVTSLLSSNVETTKIYHMCTVILSAFIQNQSDPIQSMKNKLKPVYPELVELLIEVDQHLNLPFVEIVAKYGKACGFPGAFIGAYACLRSNMSYTDAVRLNITAGGCNCSRSNLIGACLGAKHGIDGIPVDWLEKVCDIEKLIDMSIRIVSC